MPKNANNQAEVIKNFLHFPTIFQKCLDIFSARTPQFLFRLILTQTPPRHFDSDYQFNIRKL